MHRTSYTWQRLSMTCLSIWKYALIFGSVTLRTQCVGLGWVGLFGFLCIGICLGIRSRYRDIWTLPGFCTCFFAEGSQNIRSFWTKSQFVNIWDLWLRSIFYLVFRIFACGPPFRIFFYYFVYLRRSWSCGRVCLPLGNNSWISQSGPKQGVWYFSSPCCCENRAGKKRWADMNV